MVARILIFRLELCCANPSIKLQHKLYGLLVFFLPFTVPPRPHFPGCSNYVMGTSTFLVNCLIIRVQGGNLYDYIPNFGSTSLTRGGFIVKYAVKQSLSMYPVLERIEVHSVGDRVVVGIAQPWGVSPDVSHWVALML